MVTIAYLIASYKEPERISRLVKRLATKHTSFYIHFDKRIGTKKFVNWKRLIEDSCKTEKIEIVSHVRVKWGSFGLTQVTLQAMSYFENIDYKYFINLSGDSYSLKSAEKIEAEFEDNTKGFMKIWNLPYDGWHRGGLNRIRNNYFFMPKKLYPYVRIFSIPRIRKKMPCGLKLYGGYAWFCLPKQLVNYSLEFVRQNPTYKRFFKRTFAPGEMFFHTILMNSVFKDRIRNDDRTYMEFEGPHPRNLTIHDYDKLKKSDKLFARKFDLNVDEEILDMIDHEI